MTHPGVPGRPSPEQRLASRRWRVLNSWWVLPPLLSIGLLCWLGFLVAGIQLRKPKYWLSSLFWFVLAALTMWSVDGTGMVETAFTVGLLLAWFGAPLQALIMNRSYLRELAHKRPWYAPWPGLDGDAWEPPVAPSRGRPLGPAGGAPHPGYQQPWSQPGFQQPLRPQAQPAHGRSGKQPVPPQPAQHRAGDQPAQPHPGQHPGFASEPSPLDQQWGLPDELSRPAQQWGDPAPSQHPVDQPGPASSPMSEPWAAPQEFSPVENLQPSQPQFPTGADPRPNVNTVDYQTLSSLPGVGPELAQRIIEAREQRGGFFDLDDLAIAVGLLPQDVERLSWQVMMTRGERGFWSAP